jgi:spore photoproduct lyase
LIRLKRSGLFKQMEEKHLRRESYLQEVFFLHKQFEPKRVLFEEAALNYSLGRELWERFSTEGIEVKIIASHNRVTGLPGKSPPEMFKEAKRTLVVGVRRGKEFASCRPSADFQLVLSTSCPGMCEYCYLHTTLGRRPVVRLYVNIEEILSQAQKVIEGRQPDVTTFEGAATSDPLPLERFSGALAQSIHFFAGQDYGRFRFVTKFTGVEPLLGLQHNGRTTIRFSVNTAEIIRRFEHGTPRLKERLEAAAKVDAAGFPYGFLIAPIFISQGWKEEYLQLLQEMASVLVPGTKPFFELITHRFTRRGKDNIAAVFPASVLPLSEDERRFKFGQFGYGKYVYTREDMAEVESFFKEALQNIFPSGRILYIV